MTSAIGTVFISVQRRRDLQQAAFLAGVEGILQSCGLAWITLDQGEDAPPDPLPGIRAALQSCHGALVIAFERWRADKIVEYPDMPYAVARDAHRLPTVWNQIEAAMAYQTGLPMFVLTEKGLHEQGMISTRRTSLRVARFTLEPGANESPDPATAAVIGDWCRALAARIAGEPPASAHD